MGQIASKQAKISAEAWHQIAGATAAGKCREPMKVHCSKILAIGETAVVGAGFGIALIGAMEIATAITVQQWLTEAKNYTDYAPLVGGAVGVIVGGLRIARRRRGAAAKIAGVSTHAVARGRAEFGGISQVAKSDETIGADSKAKPARKPSANIISLPTSAKVSR